MYIVDMKVDNIIEVGEAIDQSSVLNIKTQTLPYIINNGKLIKVLDGSISEDIVINATDKEKVNEECEQTNKLLNEERESRREVYFRQARVLYPDKPEWCLSLAIDAFMEQEDNGIDILTHKFGSSNETPAPLTPKD
jgi:hypothetical protein